MRADVRRQLPLAQAISEVQLAEAGRSTLCPSLWVKEQPLEGALVWHSTALAMLLTSAFHLCCLKREKKKNLLFLHHFVTQKRRCLYVYAAEESLKLQVQSDGNPWVCWITVVFCCCFLSKRCFLPFLPLAVFSNCPVKLPPSALYIARTCDSQVHFFQCNSSPPEWNLVQCDRV